MDYNQDEIRSYLGDGAGNFNYASSTFAPIDENNNKGIVSGDINGDGVADLVFAGDAAASVSTLIGNGDGSFSVGEGLATGAAISSVELFDYDFDGIADLVTRSSSGWSIYRGTTAGVFEEVLSETSTPNNIHAEDLNGDGLVDLVINGDHDGQFGIHSFLNQGDGTFEHTGSLLADAVVHTATGDLNGDGVPDIVVGRTSGQSGVIVAINGSEEAVRMSRVNLTTQYEARQAFQVIDQGLERVSREISAIGAAQSRLSTAVSNLTQSREVYSAAKSRIEDVDVAEESGRLVRGIILQQAGSAVLAQANLSPELVLLLI